MVRDPSIVSPTLTGVFIGGGHNKHGAGSRCTLLTQCRPPSPRRRWRCDRSSYKRSLFSRIRDSLMHYLTGPETTSQHPVTVSGLCGIEPLRMSRALQRDAPPACSRSTGTSRLPRRGARAPPPTAPPRAAGASSRSFRRRTRPAPRPVGRRSGGGAARRHAGHVDDHRIRHLARMSKVQRERRKSSVFAVWSREMKTLYCEKQPH